MENSYTDPRRGLARQNAESTPGAGERRPGGTGTAAKTKGRTRGRPAAGERGSAGARSDLGRALGPLMREARKREQLTLQEVAQRAELSVSYLSQIERNLLTPSVGTLKRIAGALGIPTGQLIAPEASTPRPLVAVLRKSQRKRVAFPQS